MSLYHPSKTLIQLASLNQIEEGFWPQAMLLVQVWKKLVAGYRRKTLLSEPILCWSKTAAWAWDLADTRDSMGENIVINAPTVRKSLKATDILSHIREPCQSWENGRKPGVTSPMWLLVFFIALLFRESCNVNQNQIFTNLYIFSNFFNVVWLMFFGY